MLSRADRCSGSWHCRWPVRQASGVELALLVELAIETIGATIEENRSGVDPVADLCPPRNEPVDIRIYIADDVVRSGSPRGQARGGGEENSQRDARAARERDAAAVRCASESPPHAVSRRNLSRHSVAVTVRTAIAVRERRHLYLHRASTATRAGQASLPVLQLSRWLDATQRTASQAAGARARAAAGVAPGCGHAADPTTHSQLGTGSSYGASRNLM